MNLNQHLVPIRAREFPAICDLAFQLVCKHIVSLAAGLALFAFPLGLVNWTICQLGIWDLDIEGVNPNAGLLQVLLVFLEAQLATVVITVWLGRAMFQQQATIGNSLRDVFSRMLPTLIVQMVLRPTGFLFFVLILAVVAGNGDDFGMAVAVGFFTSLLVAIARFGRPFANEIVLLERTPFFNFGSGSKPQVTYSQRTRNLHGFSGSTIWGRSLATVIIAGALVLAFYSFLMFLDQILTLGLGNHIWARQLFWVIGLWVTAGITSVIRFLSYIDLRVRQEGWDAELKLRAEAARLLAA